MKIPKLPEGGYVMAGDPNHFREEQNVWNQYSPDGSWHIHYVSRCSMEFSTTTDFLLEGVSYSLAEEPYCLRKVYPRNCWSDLGRYSMMQDSTRRAKFLYKIKGQDKSILTLDQVDANCNRTVRIPEAGKLFTGKLSDKHFYQRINDFIKETWGGIQYVITADKNFPIPNQICNIAERDAARAAYKQRIEDRKNQKLNQRQLNLLAYKARRNK